VEEEMVHNPTLQSTSDLLLRSEPKRTAVVEDAEARIIESVVLVLRNCPPEILAEKAREELHALRPCLEEALGALEDFLKGRRSLTETECSQRYTFQMLLACRR
jgi:hypothetical protein